MPGPRLEKAKDPNVFDMQTHVFNGRGKLEGTNTYRLHNTDGVNRFERPVGSGNLWFDNNEPAGRIEVIKDAKGRSVGKKFDFDAKHKEFKRVTDPNELQALQLADEKAKNEALMKELAAIKAEQAVKMESKRVVGDKEYIIDSAPEDKAPAPAEEKESPKKAEKSEGMAAMFEGISPSIKSDAAKAAVKDAAQVGKAPTPANVHADRAAAEAARLSKDGEGLPPTPANVHAERAAKAKK